GSLYRSVYGLTFGARPQVVVAVVYIRDGPHSAEDRPDDSVSPDMARCLFHILPHAGVGVVVVVNGISGFGARETGSLRQPERTDVVGDREIDDLGQSPVFRLLFLSLGPKDRAGGAGMDVFSRVERSSHRRVPGDMSKDTKFDLRVIGGHQD